MKRFFKKLILFILVVVIIVSIVGFFSLRSTLKNSLPALQGTFKVAGLQQPVTILRDSMGIPQIFAQNEADVYFAQGYLHAADRLFQIDLTRRLATGRLSALLGRVTLNFDRYNHLIGHYRLAQKFVKQLDPETKRKLQAYVDGVNYWATHTKSLPLEYHLLRTSFEPYTITELLSVLSFQTWFANFLQNSDEWFLKVAERIGFEKAKDFMVPYPTWAPLTVPQQKDFSVQSWLFNQYFADAFLPLRMAHSSNSWVVSPQKSVSGHSMLASDPHLETRRLPQFWYLSGLHVANDSLHVLGISTPGLPFVVMGHNGQKAWAFTVGAIDISEIYIEKRHPKDSTLYFNGHDWYRCQMFVDTIEISGEDEPYIFRYKWTQNGPIIWSADSMKQDYSLHWAGFDVNLAQGVQSAFHLAKVRTFDEFRQTVTHFGALDVNWTYADRQGNIGYQLGTPIPIRPLAVKKLPLPGWVDSLKWRGFHALNETPHSFNPAQGWLATCNNKQDQAHLNYPLFGKFFAERIVRITELLSQNRKFSVKDMQTFQLDRIDRYLQKHWLNVLVEALKSNGHLKLAQRMSQWDGSMEANSHEAALMILFLTQLKKAMLADELGEKLVKRLTDEDFEQIFKSGPVYYFDNQQTQNHLESRQEIVTQALNRALELWRDQSWGQIHTLTMAHPFARVPFLSWLLPLKIGPIPWGGSSGTLNVSFILEDKQQPGHFKSFVGPSWRFVIDFADPDQATFVLPAGISGNPISPFFLNFFEWWKNGKRWPIPLSAKKVKQRAKYVLNLQPVH